MNPDGISYLNIAELLANGDVLGAANSYWSPLFPSVLAAVLKITKPSIYSEAPIVHATNYLIFVAAAVCFYFFLQSLRALQVYRSRATPARTSLRFTTLSEQLCGWSLFGWSTIVLIGFHNVTPDMLVAAIVYLAAALSVRCLIKPTVLRHGLLGVVIALGYLTKAVMFPIGLVMLASLWIKSGVSTRTRAVAVLAFAAVAGPHVISQSMISGRFTYADTGHIAYAVEVNGVPRWWTGLEPGTGIPADPIRLINRAPDTYEFGMANPALSYPLWDKTAHWMRDVQPRFEAPQQLRVIKQSLNAYATWFGLITFSLLTLYLMSAHRIGRDCWSILVPTALVFALYAVVHAEARYLGAWAGVAFLIAAAGLEFRRRAQYPALAVMCATALFTSATVINQSRYSIREALELGVGKGDRNEQADVASVLRSNGLVTGNRVAVIGDAFNAYWARLADLQISAQVPDSLGYWAADDSTRLAVAQKLIEKGIVAIVASKSPGMAGDSRWQSLGVSNLSLRPLSVTEVHPSTSARKVLTPSPEAFIPR